MKNPAGVVKVYRKMTGNLDEMRALIRRSPQRQTLDSLIVSRLTLFAE